MAIFSRKKDEVKTDTTSVKKEQIAKPALETENNLSSVIIKPHVTEKSVSQNEKNVYIFMVKRDASKYEIKAAVQQLFKVTPVRVNTVNKRPRRFMSRRLGRQLVEKGTKKAYVYLKDGDSISII